MTNTQETITRIISQEILSNQSLLVEHMLSAYDESNEFSYDDIVNLYDTSKDTLLDWIYYNISKEELKEYLEYKYSEAFPIESYDYDELLELAYAFNFEPEPQEIYQWWIVSDWLADKLEQHGEPVLRNNFGVWWGRTCCGQAIESDGVIQDIAKELTK